MKELLEPVEDFLKKNPGGICKTDSQSNFTKKLRKFSKKKWKKFLSICDVIHGDFLKEFMEDCVKKTLKKF